MEETKEYTINSFKNTPSTQSVKLKRLSLKSKHSLYLSNYGLEYKQEAVSLDVLTEENTLINLEPVTKEGTLIKKFKKSEVSPVSLSTEHHQNSQNLMGSVQPMINSNEEPGEYLYSEEQTLVSNVKDKNELAVNYDSLIESNAHVYSKEEDNNKELETSVCSFRETNSVNKSIIQNSHELNEGDNNEDNKVGSIAKPENEDYDSPTSQTHECNKMEYEHDCQKNTEDVCKSAEKRRYKFSSIKRRAGLLYKQIMNSKLNSVNSEYFLLKKNCSDISKLRWIPPRSPYSLIQEDLFDKPWQLLVATIFLTKVSAKKALPQIHKFLKRWPRPEDLLLANEEELYEYMKPLGLTVTRSHAIMRFTVEFLEKDWKYPRELYGIGKYGDDSYRMFCINEWRQVRPDDIPLNLYRNWLLENADALGIK